MVKNNTKPDLVLVLAVGFVIGVVFSVVVGYLWVVGDDNGTVDSGKGGILDMFVKYNNMDRMTRVDTFCDIKRVEYMCVELVNENMTLKHVRDLYCSDIYLTHKKVLVESTLNYVCDGRGEWLG